MMASGKKVTDTARAPPTMNGATLSTLGSTAMAYARGKVLNIILRDSSSIRGYGNAA
jgi:hypothetical protein